MFVHSLTAAAPVALSTSGLVSYLQGLFGPLFLGIVGIVALFFLFTREIIRFVQFVVLAVAIAVIFYTPSIVQTLAQGMAKALGVHRSPHGRKESNRWSCPPIPASGGSRNGFTSCTTSGFQCRCQLARLPFSPRSRCPTSSF